MKKSFLNLFSALFTFTFLIASIYSCSDDDPITPSGPANNTINGKIKFVDTNFILSGGTYLISAYANTAWPPMSGPAAFDTISLTRSNNILNLEYNYTLKDINPGSYVVSIGFRKTTGGQSPIMSVYGCDTARAAYGNFCFTNPPVFAVIGSGNQGLDNINLLSWSDTSKAVNNATIYVDPNTINGRITFVDTNFILSGGLYLISAYPNTGWPPIGPPAAFDTVKVTRTNNVLNTNYNYSLRNVNPGSFVVSVGFRKSTGGQSPIMSVYGCDTARAIYGSMCFLNPPLNAVIGTGNQGVENINMISWADTSKKVY